MESTANKPMDKEGMSLQITNSETTIYQNAVPREKLDDHDLDHDSEVILNFSRVGKMVNMDGAPSTCLQTSKHTLVMKMLLM